MIIGQTESLLISTVLSEYKEVSFFLYLDSVIEPVEIRR